MRQLEWSLPSWQKGHLKVPINVSTGGKKKKRQKDTFKFKIVKKEEEMSKMTKGHRGSEACWQKESAEQPCIGTICPEKLVFRN